MRETKKIEGFTFAATFSFPPRRTAAAELDQAGFLGMEVQAKLPETVLHRSQTGPCIGFVLESQHEIVRIAYHYAVASGIMPAPVGDPQIEHIVQEDIG